MHASTDLLAASWRGLGAASRSEQPAERYAQAHLAALRAAAAVLAARARPSTGQRSRPRSVWVLLPRVAPELTEWAQFFASGATKRSLAEAGIPVVTAREADDLLRDARALHDQIAAMLHISIQESLSDSLSATG